jgi:hypothetical protein
MNRTRALVLMWLVLGALLWAGTFQVFMYSPPREYLLQNALWELGRGPEPIMTELLAKGVRDGVSRATLWTVIMVGAGLLTIRLRK